MFVLDLPEVERSELARKQTGTRRLSLGCRLGIVSGLIGILALCIIEKDMRRILHTMDIYCGVSFWGFPHRSTEFREIVYTRDLAKTRP